MLPQQCVRKPDGGHVLGQAAETRGERLTPFPWLPSSMFSPSQHPHNTHTQTQRHPSPPLQCPPQAVSDTYPPSPTLPYTWLCRSEPCRRPHIPMPTRTHPPSKTTATRGLFLLSIHVLPKCILLPFFSLTLNLLLSSLLSASQKNNSAFPPSPTPPSTPVSLHFSAAHPGPAPPRTQEASTPGNLVTTSPVHFSLQPSPSNELGPPAETLTLGYVTSSLGIIKLEKKKKPYFEKWLICTGA